MPRNDESQQIQKEWCVMVYFAADDDLIPYALSDLEEMKSAGSSDQVDLLAEINSGGNKPIKRYYLQKGSYVEEDRIIDRDENGKEKAVLSKGAEPDLVDFIEWVAGVSKAKNYMLVLWGHGQGWKADDPDPCKVPGAGNPRKVVKLDKENFPGLDKSAWDLDTNLLLPLTPPFLPNADGADYLNIPMLESALKKGTDKVGKKIAVLGMDACLMAMAEVAYQVGNNADYFVASEDIVPDESWPYGAILDLLVRYPEQMTPADLARTIVWKFTFGFGQQKKYVTQSICNVQRDAGKPANKLIGAVKNLVDVLVGRSGETDSDLSNPEVRWAAMIARGEVQAFHITEYVDLYDFCRLLALNCNAAPVVKACESVMNCIAGKKASADLQPSNTESAEASSGTSPNDADRFVVDFGTYGQSLLWSNGVSIYFPSTGPVQSCYGELAFCVETKWNEFLDKFLTSPTGRSAIALVPAKTPKPGDPEPVVAPIVGGVVAPVGDGTNKTVYNDPVKSTRNDPIKEPEAPFWHLSGMIGTLGHPTLGSIGRQGPSRPAAGSQVYPTKSEEPDASAT